MGCCSFLHAGWQPRRGGSSLPGLHQQGEQMSILLRALISHFGAWLAECAHSRGVLPGFHCCMLLSLCLGHHTPSAGGPFSALTPSIWPQEILAKYTQVRRGAGFCAEKKGPWWLSGSPNTVGEKRERGTVPPLVWLQTLVCLSTFICLVSGSRKRILQGVKQLGRVIALPCGNSCSTAKMLTLGGSLCHHRAALGGLHAAGRARRQVGRAGRKEAALELCNLPAGFAEGSCAQRGRLELSWELC